MTDAKRHHLPGRDMVNNELNGLLSAQASQHALHGLLDTCGIFAVISSAHRFYDSLVCFARRQEKLTAT